jgi:hypothetical protein
VSVLRAAAKVLLDLRGTVVMPHVVAKPDELAATIVVHSWLRE